MKKIVTIIVLMLLAAFITNCGNKQDGSKSNPLVEMIHVKGGTFKMLPVGGNESEGVDTVKDFYIAKYEFTGQALYEVITAYNKILFDKIKEIEKTDFEKAKSHTTKYVEYNENGELYTKDVDFALFADLKPIRSDLYFSIRLCNYLSEIEGLKPAYSLKGSTDIWDWGPIDNWDSVACDFTANGYRLPTRMEWEYAARGGEKSQGYKYSGGSNYLKIAWMSENSGDSLHAVGTKEPNELGLYDFTGNVNEWCWEKYIWKETERAVRGGAYNSDASECLLTAIFTATSSSSIGWYSYAGGRSFPCGLRVVRSADISEKTSEVINKPKLENSANEDINNKNTNSDIDVKTSEIKSDVAEVAEENIPIEKPQSEIEQVETAVIANELIHESDLTKFNKDEIRKIRNTIYAKHGRKFKSADLQEYFNTKGWYKINENYSDNLLTENDLKNIKIIQKYE